MYQFKIIYLRFFVLIGLILGFTKPAIAQYGCPDAYFRHVDEKVFIKETLVSHEKSDIHSIPDVGTELSSKDVIISLESAEYLLTSDEAGIIGIPAPDSLKAYPNPTTGIVNLEIISSKDIKTKILIYNLLGTQILDIPISLHQGKNLKQLDLGNLATGNYFLSVFFENKSRSLMFSKTD